LSSDRYRDPNPDCPVCNPAHTRVAVNLDNATLNNLVHDVLRLQLGYGDEFFVNTDVGTIYDADEVDNLHEKLSHFGMPYFIPC